MLPIKLGGKDFLLFNRALANYILEQLLELAARYSPILILVTHFKDVVDCIHADINAYLPEGSFHF